MIAIILEAMTVSCVTATSACVISFGMASCRFMIAFATDVEVGINNLDEENQTKESDGVFAKKVCQLIDFHSIVQR